MAKQIKKTPFLQTHQIRFEPHFDQIISYLDFDISDYPIRLKYRIHDIKQSKEKNIWKIYELNKPGDYIEFNNLKKATRYEIEYDIYGKKYVAKVMTAHHVGFSTFNSFKVRQISWNQIMAEFSYLAGDLLTQLEYSFNGGKDWQFLYVSNPEQTEVKRVIIQTNIFKHTLRFRYHFSKLEIYFSRDFEKKLWQPLMKPDIYEMQRAGDKIVKAIYDRELQKRSDLV